MLHFCICNTCYISDRALPNSHHLAFLDLLLTMLRDGKLSLTEVQQEVDTFMFEGHDTTATSLAWFIQLMGEHPEIQVSFPSFKFKTVSGWLIEFQCTYTGLIRIFSILKTNFT